jgi:hypothetical protein
MNNTSSPPPDLDGQVRQVQRRTAHYWFEDGVVELVIGGGFLLLGLCFVILGTIPLPGFTTLLPMALMIGLLLAGPRLIRRAKDRLVHPRTGFVSFARPSPRRRWLTAIVAAVTAMLFVVLFGRKPSLAAWVPAVLGLLMAGFFLRTNHAAQLARLSFLAGASAITGLLLSLYGHSDQVAGGIYFAIVGFFMAAGGALALRRYLRNAPPPEGA